MKIVKKGAVQEQPTTAGQKVKPVLSAVAPKKETKVVTPAPAPVEEKKVRKVAVAKAPETVAEPPKEETKKRRIGKVAVPVEEVKPEEKPVKTKAPKQKYPTEMPSELETDEGKHIALDVSFEEFRKMFYSQANASAGFPFRLLGDIDGDEYIELIVVFIDKEGMMTIDINTNVREKVDFTPDEINSRSSNGFPIQLYQLQDSES